MLGLRNCRLRNCRHESLPFSFIGVSGWWTVSLVLLYRAHIAACTPCLCLSVCLSACLSVCLPACLPASLCLSLSLSFSFSLSVSLFFSFYDFSVYCVLTKCVSPSYNRHSDWALKPIIYLFLYRLCLSTFALVYVDSDNFMDS